jgi:hypothetical protein
MENKGIAIGGLITLILGILTLAFGNGLLLIAFLVVGASTIIAVFASCESLSWVYHGITIITSIILFIAILLIATFANTTIVSETSTYHEMYSVTAPFGVIWVNQAGEINGGLFYTHGSLESSLTESYVAKFVVGNELRTITTDKPLIIDGNFTLEEKITTRHSQSLVWSNVSINPDNVTTSWIIHIPSLPQNNQTANGDYIYVP